MRKSFALVTAGLAVLAVFFWIYFPALSRYRDLKIQEEQMSAERKDLNQRITALTEEKKLLETDPAYLEKVIRDELGLVKPGEVIYKFVQAEAPAVRVSKPPEEPTPTLPDLPEHRIQLPDLDKKVVDSSPANVPQAAPAALPSAPSTPKKKEPAVVNGEPVYPRRETR